MDTVTTTFENGKACFVIPAGGRMGDADPALMGWFVDINGKWTVALLIDGAVVFVSGYPRKDSGAGSP